MIPKLLLFFSNSFFVPLEFINLMRNYVVLRTSLQFEGLPIFLICKRAKHSKGAGEGSSAPNEPPLPFPNPATKLSWMFSKIGVLKNFAIFTGKRPCWKRL